MKIKKIKRKNKKMKSTGKKTHLKSQWNNQEYQILKKNQENQNKA